MADCTGTRSTTLTEGVEVRCPNCREFHKCFAANEKGTPYEREMLYVACGHADAVATAGCRATSSLFYIGQTGKASRHEVRSA